MIAIAALVGLLSLSLPSGAVASESRRSDRERLAESVQSIREFKTMNGGYPSSLEDLEPPLYRIHPDSAGRPPVYRLADDGTSFELTYLGPDGLEDTADDIRYEAKRRP